MPDAADTSRRELEQLELGRLALVGRLARGVVHELNNPLFVVLALAELMGRVAEPGSQAADRLFQMHESGLEMRRLIAAIGDLARVPIATAPEPVLVEPLLAEAVDLLRRVTLRKDIDVVERYADEGAVVLASRGELRFAVMGLLSEAQESTPEDGRIEVASTQRGDRLVVTVRWPAATAGTGGAPAPLDAILRAAVERSGGTLRLGAGAAGGREALLSLPVHVAAVV